MKDFMNKFYLISAMAFMLNHAQAGMVLMNEDKLATVSKNSVISFRGEILLIGDQGGSDTFYVANGGVTKTKEWVSPDPYCVIYTKRKINENEIISFNLGDHITIQNPTNERIYKSTTLTNKTEQVYFSFDDKTVIKSMACYPKDTSILRSVNRTDASAMTVGNFRSIFGWMVWIYDPFREPGSLVTETAKVNDLAVNDTKNTGGLADKIKALKYFTGTRVK